MAFSWDGSAPSLRTFIIDSAVGLGARTKPPFLDQVHWLENYLRMLPPPSYPFGIDKQLAASGSAIFQKHCFSCHGGFQTGTVVPINEIATDRNRLDILTQEIVDGLNKAIDAMVVDRMGIIKTDGYIASHLDGIWLRGPYLHNGSIPTLRDLLEPPNKRPPVFYRGFDVYDPVNVGFDTKTAEAQQVGSKIDVTQKGNGNQGHLYGTTLSLEEKDALIEYMKTL
jgi:hypothetical protein